MTNITGDKITRMSNCNCGSTSGCNNCNPELFNTQKDCDHDFKYSHIEYPPTGNYSNILVNREVVVCRKCGEIKKNKSNLK